MVTSRSLGTICVLSFTIGSIQGVYAHGVLNTPVWNLLQFDLWEKNARLFARKCDIYQFIPFMRLLLYEDLS